MDEWVDIDCGDVIYEEAQTILASDTSDPHGLDADYDGVACELDAGATGVGQFDVADAGSLGAIDPGYTTDTGYITDPGYDGVTDNSGIGTTNLSCVGVTDSYLGTTDSGTTGTGFTDDLGTTGTGFTDDLGTTGIGDTDLGTTGTGYTDDPGTTTGYTDPGYTDPGYTDPGYTDPACVDATDGYPLGGIATGDGSTLRTDASPAALALAGAGIGGLALAGLSLVRRFARAG